MFIPQLRHITTYHADMRTKGSNMVFMAFNTNKGTERQIGWVVSVYAGNDSHRYFKNEKLATEFRDNHITY